MKNQPEFYDSPDTALEEIVAVKNRIGAEMPKNLNLGWRGKNFWQDLDHDSVDIGDFHGNPEKNARTLYHRLFARFLAERLYRSQYLVFLFSAILTFCGVIFEISERGAVLLVQDAQVKSISAELQSNDQAHQTKIEPLLSNQITFLQEVQPFLFRNQPIPAAIIKKFNDNNKTLEQATLEFNAKQKILQRDLLYFQNLDTAYQIVKNSFGIAINLIGLSFVALICYFCLLPGINRYAILRGDREREEAAGVVRRIYLRDFAATNPPRDLKDVWRHGWITTEGRPLSTEVCADDYTTNVLETRANAWILPSIMLVLSTLAFRGVLMPFTIIIFWVVILCDCIDAEKKVDVWIFRVLTKNVKPLYPILMMFLLGGGFWAIWKWFFDRSPALIRGRELEKQAPVDAATYVMAGGYPWGQVAETARLEQCRLAGLDTSPLFKLGTTVGMLAARSDLYAPSAGLPFSLSLKDLTQHLLVLGGIGSGKTAGILRPLAHQACQCEKLGIVVLDGKGALPGELANLPGMQIIDPRYCRVSLVSGLEPVTLVDTLIDVVGARKNKEDQFFTDSAADLLRKAAILAKAAGDAYWTLESIGRVATNKSYLQEVILAIPAVEQPQNVGDAAEFFTEDWVNTEDRVKSNIIATARSWLNTIMSHPDLLAWARTDDHSEEIDITRPLQGGRIGILIPDYRYGRGGAVVTALLKARLYEGIKKRAERREPNETPVLLMMDEAQEIATQDDAALLAIGRSLDLAVVAATQTVEGVIEKLGETTAKKWFGIYGSLIGLKGRSNPTYEFIASRMGESWRAQIERAQGITINQSAGTNSVHGIRAASLHQESLQQIDVKTAETKPGIDWERAVRKRTTSSDITTRIKVTKLLEPGEIEDMLAIPGTALAAATRASVARRDVIQLDFLFPEDISSQGTP
jgi:hypothetical protein